ncbi:hypothetical protein C8Q76DRAFT_792253 [Earliella scabrosa]|nr:hypothetical protein C8Q76DRAFT_792253 [Earliella scabrosa]
MLIVSTEGTHDAKRHEAGSDVTTDTDLAAISIQTGSGPRMCSTSPDMRTLIAHPIFGPGAHNALSLLPSRSLLALLQLWRQPTTDMDLAAISIQIGSGPRMCPTSPDMRTLIAHPIFGPGAQNALSLLPSRSLLTLVLQLCRQPYPRGMGVVDAFQLFVHGGEFNGDGLFGDLARFDLFYQPRADAFDEDAVERELESDDDGWIYYEVVDVGIQTDPTLSDSSSDLATEYADVACQADGVFDG